MGVAVDGVLFDYYFTLADPETDHARSAAQALLPEGADYAALWEAWRVLRAPDVARALSGEPPEFRTFGSRWDEHGPAVFRSAAVEGEASLWRRCREASHACAAIYDDVRPALKTLRDGGLRLGVLSDADTEWLAASVAQNELQFDAVVSSEELHCYKPHESVFLAACNRLGTAAASTVYVGDNPRLDVVGARNAGLTAVWLNRRGAHYPEHLEPPHHTIESLSELQLIVSTDRPA